MKPLTTARLTCGEWEDEMIDAILREEWEMMK